MSASATRSIVVGVSDLEASLGLFRDVMGLALEAEWTAGADLCALWGLPAGTGARLAELSCKGYPFGRLVLAQYEPGALTKVRLDHGSSAPDSPLDIGPKAIDFYVADPIGNALGKVVAAGYPARSAPRKHQIGKSISEEVVITGPDDLPMLLMVGHRHASTSLRPGSPDGLCSEIATASVIAGDLDASRRFYGDVLGLVPVNDAETPEAYRDLVCELVDAPRGTRVHFLLYAAAGEASGKILLIHFHGASTRRLEGRMRPGHLGFSLFVHEVDDADAMHRACLDAGARVVAPPQEIVDREGARRRALIVEGPNCELFQLQSRAS